MALQLNAASTPLHYLTNVEKWERLDISPPVSILQFPHISLQWHSLAGLQCAAQCTVHSVLDFFARYWCKRWCSAVQCRLSLERNRWLEANRQKEDQRREGSAIPLNAQRCRQKLLNDSACAGAGGGKGGTHPKSKRPVQSVIRSKTQYNLSKLEVFLLNVQVFPS